MKQAVSWIAVCILLLAVGALFLRFGRSKNKNFAQPGENVKTATLDSAGNSIDSSVDASAASGDDIPLLSSDGGPVKQRVYRLSAFESKLTLEASTDVIGDFPRERPQAWLPGMWACRLFDNQGRMLSERTMNTPNYVCIVLDPNTPTEEAVPVRLTGEGPTVFQLRFPITDQAVKMEILRINTEVRPAGGNETGGQIIANFTLPLK